MSVKCIICGGSNIEEDFCAACGSLAPQEPKTDHFSTLKIGRVLNLDPQFLKQRFFELSKRYHPDKFAGADPKVRAVAFERSKVLNNAYNIIKDPFRRLGYLIQLETGRDLTAKTEGISDFLFDLACEVNAAVSKERGAQEKKELQILSEKVRSETARHGKEIDILSKKWDESQNGKEDDPENVKIKAKFLKDLSTEWGRLLYLRKLEALIRQALDGVVAA